MFVLCKYSLFYEKYKAYSNKSNYVPLKNKKKKFDRATVLYKAFLIILFTGNGYPMFTGGLTIVDYVYHVILCFLYN
jgi:hypothetical protein